ncbi:type II CAAX endopeptidase family protein [Planococcus shenhongbingii]|uniref:CPBP family intramembrane glutamic endopeptidase n=1 Tax=Planococcus shenhongbingii TaxID=3058398 RepID=UPI00260F1EFC|nr:type II CAAX endopeptidase family protein [Planococcus sp. N016]WKA59224.1 type II CAAX endopeptidase family protein [Planococcus sp. N016]
MFQKMKFRYIVGITLTVYLSMVYATTVFPLSEDLEAVLLSVAVYGIVPFWFFTYQFRLQNVSVSTFVFTDGAERWIASVIGLIVLSIAFTLSLFWLQLYVFLPVSPDWAAYLLEPIALPEDPIYLAITIGLLIFLEPVAEEFIFRGVLLSRMTMKTSRWGGILISSLLFGLAHDDIIGSFLFGIIAALLYLKTRNLLAPILLHIFYNAFFALTMAYAPAWPEAIRIQEAADIAEKVMPNAIVLAVSTLLLGLFAFWLAKEEVWKKNRSVVFMNKKSQGH